MDLTLSFSTPDSEKKTFFNSRVNSNIGWHFSYMKIYGNDNFGLAYKYRQLVEPKNDLNNITDDWEITDKECQDIMKHDVAIVNVQFATNRYTKTILDKRFSFADRLSSFGKKFTL